jgi:hypothetical protein
VVIAFNEFPRLPTVNDPRAAVRANRPRQSEPGLLDVEMDLGDPARLDRIAAGLEHNVSIPPSVALSTCECRGRFLAAECRLHVGGRRNAHHSLVLCGRSLLSDTAEKVRPIRPHSEQAPGRP